MKKRFKVSPAKLPSRYGAVLADLKVRVRAAQVRAVLAVNQELIELYWQIGREILRCQHEEGVGRKGGGTAC